VTGPARHDHREGGPAAALFPCWDIGRRVLQPAGRPLVMGILNLTPDSFFPGSRQADAGSAVDAAMAMLAAGADVLDLGAESTRPGADAVSPAEEQDRLLPAIEAIRCRCDAPLTADTRHAQTARLALAGGADAINDIGGGRDRDLVAAVADAGVGLVLMHMQGEPRTMQNEPAYANVVADVTAWLDRQAAAAVEAGVAPGRIMVDPGIGFGKRLEHNLALLANLDIVAGGRPLLLGASRKSFIADLTDAPVDDRLGGSLAAVAAAHRLGSTMVRVHDVAETVQFLAVLGAIDTAS
jgi:dihydropteroate synthase